MSENSKKGICPACGVEQPSALALFCFRCGANLNSAPEAHQSTGSVDGSDRREEHAPSFASSLNMSIKAEAPASFASALGMEIKTQTPPVMSSLSAEPKAESEPVTSSLSAEPKAETPPVTAPRTEQSVGAHKESISAEPSYTASAPDVKPSVSAPSAPSPAQPSRRETEQGRFSDGESVGTVHTVPSKRGVIACTVMLLAAILLALLTLAPIAYSGVMIDERSEVRLEFNGYEAIEVTVSSFFSYTEKVLKTTGIYKEYAKKTEDMDMDKLQRYDEEEVEDILKTQLKLTAMRNTFSTRISMIAASVLAVVYLALCLIFFITAAVALSGEISAIIRGVPSGSRATGAATGLLWLITALMPLIYYVFKQFTYFGVGAMSLFGSAGSGASRGFVFSAVVAVAASVSVLALRLMQIIKINDGRLEKKTAKGIAAFVLATVLLLSIFLPVTSIEFAGKKGSRVEYETVYMSSTDMHELSASDVKSIAATKSAEYYRLLTEEANDAVFSTSELSPYEIYNMVTVGCGRINPSVLYLAFMAATVALFVLAALLVRSILMNTLFEKENAGGVKVLKILALIASVVYAALAVTLTALASTALYDGLEIVLRIGLGAGPIVLLVLALALTAAFRVDKSESIRGGYDSPDVSYAPYVIAEL